MAHTTYIPAALTGVDTLESLKTYLDNELTQLALNSRAQDISKLKEVDLAQGETIELHTSLIEGLTATVTGLEGQITNISATLTQETTFRIAEDEALARRMVALEAGLGETQALVKSTSDVMVNQDLALATMVQEVSASMADQFASVSVTMGTLVTKTTAYAWHTLLLNSSGYVSGTYSENDGNEANITFQVDNMRVAKAGSGAVAPRTFLEVGENAEGDTTIVLSADVLKVESIEWQNLQEGSASASYGATGSTISDFTSIAGATLVSIASVEIVRGDKVLVSFDIDVTAQKSGTDNDATMTFAVYFGGTSYHSRFFWGIATDNDTRLRTPCISSRVVTVPPGTYTVALLCTQSNWNNPGSNLRTPTLTVTELRA